MMKKDFLLTIALVVNMATYAQTNLSLNGKWKFYYAHNEHSADSLFQKGFYKSDFQANDFQEITVPSCWAILGYEEPVYRTWKDEPQSEGFYIKKFYCPQNFNNKRLLMHFGGIWSSAEIWINGMWVGKHDSGYTSFSYDVSKYIKINEENTIAVRVRQVYPEYKCDTYDDWSLGGIYRDVEIESMPAKRRIDKVTVITDFDNTYTDADLIVKTQCWDGTSTTLPGNYRSPGTPFSLHYLLKKQNGEIVLDKIIEYESHPSTGRLIEEKFHIKKPDQWNAETPNLYKLDVSYVDNRKTIQTKTLKMGFREISTKDGIFKINGQAVKLRGVNRHDEWPTVGRATTREHWLKDLQLMKECNINYIRACHYQHAKGFIEMCDSIGMYVGGEISLGGAGEMMHDPKFISGMMLRVTETVERDLNNPSIVYWSVGNEDAFSEMYYQGALVTKALDSTRPVLYPWNADATLPKDIDIVSPHYWTASEYDSLCKTSDRPVITTEYVHAYGTQRMGGLEDCWKALHDNIRGAGGAVWMWADQGIVTPKKWTNMKYKSLSNGNPYLRISSEGWDGITDSYRNPTRDFYEVRNVYAPIFPIVKEVTLNKKVIIPIHNDNDFISSKDIKIVYRVYVDDMLKNCGETYLDIAPHQEANLEIETKIKNLNAGQTAYVQLCFERNGKEIARKSVMLSSPQTSVVKGRGYKWNFDEATGLPDGMRPTIWHKFNEGDQIIRKRTFDGEKYKIRLNKMVKRQNGDNTIITSDITCVINDRNHFDCAYTFIIYKDGKMDVNYTITPTITSTYAPIIGMAIKAKPKQWLGLGPDESFPNKKSYGFIGVWDARKLIGTRSAKWVETTDNRRFVLNGDGYIDRDEVDASEIRILSHVLGRSEKGRLNYPEYRIVSGKTYSGSFSVR